METSLKKTRYKLVFARDGKFYDKYELLEESDAAALKDLVFGTSPDQPVFDEGILISVEPTTRGS